MKAWFHSRLAALLNSHVLPLLDVRVAVLIHHINEKEKKLMATLEQFETQLTRIEGASTEIAAELRELREYVKQQGLAAEVEDRILTRLAEAADRLQAVVAPADPEEGEA